jgi:hypothetical protein
MGVGSTRTRWRLGLLVQQRSLLDETIDADITRSTANSTTPTLPEIRSATGANPSTGRCRPSRCGPAWAVSVRPTGAMIERFHLERCSMKCQILLLAVLVMSAQPERRIRRRAVRAMNRRPLQQRRWIRGRLPGWRAETACQKDAARRDAKPGRDGGTTPATTYCAEYCDIPHAHRTESHHCSCP